MAVGSVNVGRGGGSTAKNITYDNSKTKVDGSNVQDVLDALLGEILPKLTVEIDAGSQLTIKNGDTTLRGQANSSGTYTTILPKGGEWSVTAKLNGETAEGTVSANTIGGRYSLTLSYAKIYGVSWDKSSKTTLSRTDDAAEFQNLIPSINGSTGRSPFDSCLPWSGMKKETVGGNAMVKIPKFWYKWTDENGSLKLQIADKKVEGFHVSPAHADRGDGVGERDYVYIGRYKCDENYKSQTGKTPKTSITRDEARKGIKALGNGYFQQDFALFWTVRMLYLVEFADWDSQKVIGYGCGDADDSAAYKTGSSDSMIYHTGTMQKSRVEEGNGVQYRWIEDPWAYALEWCDGIRFSGTDIYVFKNPKEYADNSGGTNTGARPTDSGCITGWGVPTADGLDWALYPSSVGGTDFATAISDQYNYIDGSEVLCIGGMTMHTYGGEYGMFLCSGFKASTSSAFIAARLQYLPS